MQVFYDPSSIGLDYSEIMERAALLHDPIRVGGSRLVVHIQTSSEAVNDFVTLLRNMAEEKVILPNREPTTKAASGGTNGSIADYTSVYVRVRGKPKA
jgi:threonine aldolase